MKKSIKLVITLLCASLLVGCQQSKVDDNVSTNSQVTEEKDTQTEEKDTLTEEKDTLAEEKETPTEEKDTLTEENQVTPTGKIIKPLTGSMDLVNFQDEKFSASFEATDIKDAEGELKIEMEVYQTDNYDAVEISQLEIGDKIVFANKEVLVESIDNSDDMIKINGGTSVEGYCLGSIGGGVYSQIKDDKTPVYISVGIMSLKVDQEFTLIDNTAPDDEKTYFAGDLYDLMETSRVFDVDNTTGRVENGMLIEVIYN